MKKTLFVLTLAGIVIFAACTKKASPGNTVKSTNYATDIVPLVQAKCSPCHLPSKGGNKGDFENYTSAKKYGPEMLARVMKNPGDRGFMPRMNPKLSEQEISVIKKWVDEGMLEK